MARCFRVAAVHAMSIALELRISPVGDGGTFHAVWKDSAPSTMSTSQMCGYRRLLGGEISVDFFTECAWDGAGTDVRKQRIRAGSWLLTQPDLEESGAAQKIRGLYRTLMGNLEKCDGTWLSQQ